MSKENCAHSSVFSGIYACSVDFKKLNTYFHCLVLFIVLMEPRNVLALFLFSFRCSHWSKQDTVGQKVTITQFRAARKICSCLATTLF